MGATAAVGILAYGATSTAGAQKAAGKSQQNLANYNAEISAIKSDDALARGRDAESRHRLQTRKLIGSQRAAFAASGVDITDEDSTAVNVFADTAELSELDALTIRTNAAREAWGYRAEGKDYRLRGTIARMEGDAKAVGTMTSAAFSVYGAKYGAK